MVVSSTECEKEMWRQIDENLDYVSKFNELHVGKNYAVKFKGGDTQYVYVVERYDERPICIVAGIEGVSMHVVNFRFRKHNSLEEWVSYIRDIDCYNEIS